MPLRRGVPVTFTGRTLSDTVDATGAVKGAMRSLVNLIPNPTTRGTWVCRPANVGVADFSSLITPGFISAIEPIGNICYGMIASGLNAGRDQPFAYDLANNVFLPVSGITAGNTPLSPPSSGSWTPPIIAQVGSRVVVTHPGFPGETGFGHFGTKFGWFDVSGFHADVKVATVNGAPFLFGFPSLIGVQPGMAVAGPGIPAGATVVNVYPNTQSVNNITATTHTSDVVDGLSGPDSLEAGPTKVILGPGVQDGTTIISGPAVSVHISKPTTSSVVAGSFRVYGNLNSPYKGDFTSGSATVLNVTPTVDLYAGQLVNTVNVPAGTYIQSLVGTTITLTQAALTTVASAVFSVSGNVIEISAPATATTTSGVTVSIDGGTRTAPQWGAGDTAINPLPSVPVGVAQMNGRAWFAAGNDGIPFSDSLLPCVRTNGTQALTVNNAQPVTAIAPLMLSAPLTGGIVQSLIAFQADAAMQQIMGDVATNNLTMNLLSVPTGTLAPLSICPSSLGLFFMSPDGLRLIGFDAKVSDPIGQDGDGVVKPFLDIPTPTLSTLAPASRITAAAGGRTLRIDVPTLDGNMASYWYDMTRRIWTGPHTGVASLVTVWVDTFLISAFSGGPLLQRADDTQHSYSIYVEDGRPIDCEWETSLMPDTGEMAMNAIIQSTVMVALPPGQSIQVDFLSETRENLDGARVTGYTIPEAIWGQAIWGQTLMGPDSGVIRQRHVEWTQPIVFKQGSVNIRFVADPNIVIGNFYMRYQILGYMIEDLQIPAVLPANVLLADDGVTILTRDQDLTYLSPG